MDINLLFSDLAERLFGCPEFWSILLDSCTIFLIFFDCDAVRDCPLGDFSFLCETPCRSRASSLNDFSGFFRVTLTTPLL